MLVFSVIDNDSFVHLEKWKTEFLKQAQPSNANNFPFILIGNKVDAKERRVVKTEDAKRWCKENNVSKLFETSAIDATQVSECFLFAAEKALSEKLLGN